MLKIFRISLITLIVCLQFLIVFLMDQPLARSLVGKRIAEECGPVFKQGVDNFMDGKYEYNIVLFCTSIVLAVLALVRQKAKK